MPPKTDPYDMSSLAKDLEGASCSNTTNTTTALEDIILSAVKSVFSKEGKQLVNEVMSPNRDFINAKEQSYIPPVITSSEGDRIVSDLIKTIRDFSGNSSEFGSWRKSVDRFLAYYKNLENTNKYFALLMAIRNKIIGHADEVLESYNVPLNWNAIRSCLTWHYADKRDLRTLEYQLLSITQGRLTVTDFYQEVYSHLTLILNKISCMEETPEALKVLGDMYREKARDAFINGLNGDLPRLLAVKEPQDLAHALHLCEILENQHNYGRNRVNTRRMQNNNNNNYFNQRPPLPPKPKYNNNNYHSNHRNNNPWRMQNFYQEQPVQQYRYQPQQQTPNNNWSPPRPFAPKPQPKPEPMDVDESVRTRQINYMNRPQFNNHQVKRPFNGSDRNIKKQQRLFHIDQEEQNNYEANNIHFLG